MGWLITLGILTLIAITPIGAKFRYDADGIFLAVILGPIRLTILPKKKKPKKEKKTKDKAKKSDIKTSAEKKPEYQTDPGPKPNNKPAEKKKSGGPITDFLPLVNVVLKFLNDLRRKIRIDHLDVKVILAGGDPCDLAVNYGRAWAAVGNLLPRLERVFVIRKRNIDVECDFTADETLINAGLELTITIGRVLSITCLLIFRAVKELIKILIKRKGGAAK